MSRKLVCVFLLLVMLGAGAALQAAPLLSVTLTPGIDIPLGPPDAYVSGDVLYSLGIGGELTADFKLPFAQFLFLRGQAGYSWLPVVDPGTLVTPDLSLFSFGAGAGASVVILQHLQLSASAGGGYYIGVLGTQSGGNLFDKGQLQADWIISPSLKIGAGAEYRYCFTTPSADPAVPSHLYDGLGVRLGMSYTIGASNTKSVIDITDVKIPPVFPVFYQYYDTNPIGSVTIRNTDVVGLSNVKVSFFVKEYMDQPKLCAAIPLLRAGETKVVPLYALFKDSILTITEGTKAGGEIRVEYDALGAAITKSQPQSTEFLYRNAMVWDVDEKAAAFVTAKDPDLLQYAKQVMGKLGDTPAANKKLLSAVGLYEAMRSWGLKYVVDPASAYATRSTSAAKPDYLQFPVETLLYKGGDCDDLSILYAALLESVGTSAAFITIPGHIYAAFSLGLSQGEAERLFADTSDLIFSADGRAWIPVEVTALSSGFRQAWSIGAEEWRKASAEGTAGFHPVEDAWATYQPVARPAGLKKLEMPAQLRIAGNAPVEMAAITQDEVTAWEKKLKDDSPNALGVIYGRYGMYTKAIAQLTPLADKGNAPAQVNLANVYYLQGKYSLALGLYTKGSQSSSTRVAALMGIARTQSRLNNRAQVTAALAELRKLSPEAADSLAGLDSPARNAEAGADLIPWQE